MAARLIPLNKQTIVITGASSGIGLATARAAAAAGARVVMGARNGEALLQVEQELKGKGLEALYVATDVTVPEEIERLARTAVERFGAIDTWINDAGVGLFGTIEETDPDDARRLFETNYWGVVEGCLAAIRYMKGRGGAIINVGSLASDVGMPMQSAYSASKHAVKAFTDALRAELAHQGEPISVTLIKPAVIATPMREHIRNYTGHEIRLAPPLYHPDEVAHAILHAATHPVRSISVGSPTRLMGAVRGLAPWLYDRIAAGPLISGPLGKRADGTGPDNLDSPGEDGRLLDRRYGRLARPSYSTRAALHPVVTGGMLVLGGLAVAAVVKRSRARRAARFGVAALGSELGRRALHRGARLAMRQAPKAKALAKSAGRSVEEALHRLA